MTIAPVDIAHDLPDPDPSGHHGFVEGPFRVTSVADDYTEVRVGQVFRYARQAADNVTGACYGYTRLPERPLVELSSDAYEVAGRLVHTDIWSGATGIERI